ncbi:restriction endonuclease [Lentibacillus cibarius]|uniref:Restriction endonuclease n=1 Tax=Lentibacillus cibarius TaxID=2583219 RepID=A0A549YLW5_9BACI|nr:restriction endonuclease [Lentibacillus cibarius]TRM08776.1 restriction endonuclease [Lentibacillus cibarius]TRM08804.1 restriction endonuclease [Lentibacillus cibarius]TRM12878.1 restriction endonuclease [Lentibacillus cibarius]
MNKSDKNTIGTLIALLIIIPGFIFRDIFTSFIPNYIYLFLLIVVAAIISSIITSKIPDKKKKRKKSNSSGNISKSSKTNKGNIPHNRLLSDKEILPLPLEKLSWHEFERLCYLYYKSKGYKPQETSEGADGGVDLIIYNRYHQSYVAIQIKHYIRSNNQITVKEIRELHASRKNHECTLADFITTSSFTKDAAIEADKFNIKTRDINWVRNKIDKWRFNQKKSI